MSYKRNTMKGGGGAIPPPDCSPLRGDISKKSKSTLGGGMAQCALRKQVVGMIPPPDLSPEGGFSAALRHHQVVG